MAGFGLLQQIVDAADGATQMAAFFEQVQPFRAGSAIVFLLNTVEQVIGLRQYTRIQERHRYQQQHELVACLPVGHHIQHGVHVKLNLLNDVADVFNIAVFGRGLREYCVNLGITEK